MRHVWEPTGFALWNASYLLLTKINRSKTEIQKELSLLRAPVELFKNPLEKKQTGGSPSISPRGWAGLELPLLLPRHSTCSCRRQDAARSWREIPSAGSPRDPASASAQIKGQEPTTRRCAGLQRRWLAAALKDAHLQCRRFRASNPFLNVKPENPHRMEMAHQ